MRWKVAAAIPRFQFGLHVRITTFSPTDYMPESVREFLGRRVAEIGGLLLLATVGVVGVALATWSIQDPSWNHAADGPVRNLVGPAGAVTADLIMQLLGIAVVAILPPLACWGWRLLTKRELDHPRLRLALLALGGGAAAALASAFPTTDRWPLPSGLGGVIGDAVLALPRHLFGTSEPSLVIVAVALAGVMILSLTASAGFGLQPSSARAEEDGPIAYEWVPIPKSLRQPFEDDPEGEPGFGLVSLGAVIHACLSVKAGVMRLTGRRKADGFAEEHIPWPAGAD